MDYEVKTTFLSGYNLVFTAYQPSGIGRGIPDTPLEEVKATGYYRAKPTAELQEGDTVQVHRYERVHWENEDALILTEQHIVYEDEWVYYEDNWILDFDNTYNASVFWTGKPVGSGEFILPIGGMDEISDDLDSITASSGTVNNVYNSRDDGSGSGVVVTSTGMIIADGSDC